MAIATLNDFYQQQGQTLPSVSARAKIYEQNGLGSASSYQGTVAQNNALLSKLQSGSAPAAPASGQSTAASTPNLNIQAPQVTPTYTPPPPAITPAEVQNAPAPDISGTLNNYQSQIQQNLAQTQSNMTDNPFNINYDQAAQKATDIYQPAAEGQLAQISASGQAQQEQAVARAQDLTDTINTALSGNLSLLDSQNTTAMTQIKQALIGVLQNNETAMSQVILNHDIQTQNLQELAKQEQQTLGYSKEAALADLSSRGLGRAGAVQNAYEYFGLQEQILGSKVLQQQGNMDVEQMIQVQDIIQKSNEAYLNSQENLTNIATAAQTQGFVMTKEAQTQIINTQRDLSVSLSGIQAQTAALAFSTVKEYQSKIAEAADNFFQSYQQLAFKFNDQQLTLLNTTNSALLHLMDTSVSTQMKTYEVQQTELNKQAELNQQAFIANADNFAAYQKFVATQKQAADIANQSASLKAQQDSITNYLTKMRDTATALYQQQRIQVEQQANAISASKAKAASTAPKATGTLSVADQQLLSRAKITDPAAQTAFLGTPSKFQDLWVMNVSNAGPSNFTAQDIQTNYNSWEKTQTKQSIADQLNSL